LLPTLAFAQLPRSDVKRQASSCVFHLLTFVPITGRWSPPWAVWWWAQAGQPPTAPLTLILGWRWSRSAS